MTNDLLDWITIALHKEFGTDYKYYVEDIEQNTNKPCFVVGILQPMVDAKSPIKYKQVLPVVVHYFTNEKNTSNAKKSCYNIAERLWRTLEYITSKDDKTIILRGTNLSYQIVEGVLQFFITYTVTFMNEQEQIYMENGEYNSVPLSKEKE